MDQDFIEMMEEVLKQEIEARKHWDEEDN